MVATTGDDKTAGDDKHRLTALEGLAALSLDGGAYAVAGKHLGRQPSLIAAVGHVR